MGELEGCIRGIVWQENANEFKGKGLQNCGETSDDVWSRGITCEESKWKEDGSSKNENVVLDVLGDEISQNQQHKDQRNRESGRDFEEETGSKAWMVQEWL